MKTIDEVIKAFECCDHGEPDSRCEDCPYSGIGLCCLERENDALHYLKAFLNAKNALDIERVKSIEAYRQFQDAKEKLEAQTSRTMWADNHFQFEISDNPPLTLDELKQMEGKPVWIEYMEEDGENEWVLVVKNPERPMFGIPKLLAFSKDGERMYLTISGYGKRWQAYKNEK